MVTVMSICGSLRGSSLNRALLTVLEAMRPADVRLLRWDDLLAVPPFDEDTEADPGAAVLALRSGLEAADALVIATPEYNGGMPGQLKNALDWASRPNRRGPLVGMPAGVLGASVGDGGALGGVADVTRVLQHIGADVLQRTVTVPHVHRVLGPEGGIADPELRERLRVFGEQVGRAAADRSADDRTPTGRTRP